jgi:protein-L-isoaspartate O-methyltransferase
MPSPFRTFVLRVMFGVMFLAENSVIALSARQQFVKEKQRSGAPVIQTIDLGQDKLIDIFVGNGNNRSRKRSADVALARLIAHCPSFVDDLNVLELGCGFGLASAAASKHARPNHIALTDYDAHNLKRAYTSVTQLHRSKASVSRCIMNWADKTTWPNQNYDILLGSDVLREEGGIFPLVDVLQNYLCSKGRGNKPKRALIVDPVNRSNRDGFCYAAFRAGLEADPVPFPGMDDFVLISVTTA